MKTFITILFLIAALSIKSQMSNVQLGVLDSTELIKNLQPKISLETKLVSQNEKITIKVSPEAYDVYEYYVNDALVLTSVSSEEQLMIEEFGVVSVKVRGLKSNQSSAFLSDNVYLNSLPNFE